MFLWWTEDVGEATIHRLPGLAAVHTLYTGDDVDMVGGVRVPGEKAEFLLVLKDAGAAQAGDGQLILGIRT